ncbi:MAG: glycosyltransferase [Bacteroidota bacterium]
MEDKFDISLVTSDRDLGDIQPYTGIKTDTWNNYSAHTKVFYASALSLKQLMKLQQDVAADYIYLNSMFSVRFAMYPLILKRTGSTHANIILAPRGMLKQSALKFSALKKKIFLLLFRVLKIQKQIHFHATDITEETDIRKIMGESPVVTLIPNFPGIQKSFVAPLEKNENSLSIIFVGRIHPIKKLDFLLKSLQFVIAEIKLTIVAAKEDEQYWESCKKLIDELPSNIKVDMKGNVPHDELEDILLQHHIFALPTEGENFGHAIFESLAAGRPVLISDQTPWKNLSAHHAGWDLPLNSMHSFTDIIERVAAMKNEEYLPWCTGAWQYCNDFIENAGIKQQYIKLFN